MPVFVETRSLVHTYALEDGGEVRALQGVELTIDQGEYVTLVGPNGSGKSTLAHHLNALLLPTSGEVRIAGMLTSDPESCWAIREQVGIIFQNPENQIVASTVEEDVAFGPENLGLPADEIRRRVDDALRLVGMTEYAARPPHMLSGGQKQRVAIAGVLAMRPACIVLDEPTAMLDPLGQGQTSEIIKQLNHDEGITIVWITQSMDEAALAHRVIAMDGGRIILDGPPADVFQHGDALNKAGLGLPVGAHIAEHLRKLGLCVAEDVLTIEQLVRSIC